MAYASSIAAGSSGRMLRSALEHPSFGHRPGRLPLHYDLHCHSTISDGTLTPSAVVERAAARGVDVLALTDHDELGGLDEARAAAERVGIRLIDGVELSVSWRDLTLHIVGLGIDPRSPALRDGLERIRSGRHGRARRIGDALAAVGIHGAYEGAVRHAANGELVSRAHFARFLVDIGIVKDVREVFKRYLTPGKPGYVEHAWATLGDAIGWIHGAGGQAVLAHPGRYRTDRDGMHALLTEFKALGGDAIEVLTSSHTSAQYDEYTSHALRYGFLASCGSDYHGPGESWMDFGELPPLPPGLTPVWHQWDDRHAGRSQ